MMNPGKMWRQMMDIGLFDESYPQRLNACFHYLCFHEDGKSSGGSSSGNGAMSPFASFSSGVGSSSSGNGHLTFTLKDLITKGSYIFTYLSIDVERDSSFATMDTFRLFDRSGRGTVHLEEFAIGIIEKLNLLRKDIELLTIIANDLLEVESRCTELATLLEKGIPNGPQTIKFKKYDSNLKALSHLIRSQIRAIKYHDNLSALDTKLLLRIFQTSLAQVVADIQSYFHIPISRMTGMANLTSVIDDIGHEPLPLSMTWIVSNNIARDGERDRTDDHEAWMNGASGHPEDHISHFDEGRLKRMSSHHHHHHSLVGNYDWQSLLTDIPGISSNTDADKLLNSGVAVDSTQLHLLQEALLSLNNYFNLKASNTINNEENNSESLIELFPSPLLKQRRRRSSKDDTVDSDNNHNHNKQQSISLIDISSKLKEYKDYAGFNNMTSINSNNAFLGGSGTGVTSSDGMMMNTTGGSLSGIGGNDVGSSGGSVAGGTGGGEVGTGSGGSGTGGGSGNTNIISMMNQDQLLLENILAEDLFHTQDILSRKQTRLHILELIQSQLIEKEGNQMEGEKGDHHEDHDQHDIDDDVWDSEDDDDHDDDDHGDGGMDTHDDDHSHSVHSNQHNHDNASHSSVPSSTGGPPPVQGLIRRKAIDRIVPFQQQNSQQSMLPTVVRKPRNRVPPSASAPSYDKIMRELSSLGVSLSARSGQSFPLGLFLEHPATIMDIPVVKEDHPEETNTTNSTSNSVDSNNIAIRPILQSIEQMTKDIHEELNKRIDAYMLKESVTLELKQKEIQLSEFRTKMEQVELDRNEYMALSLELQVLREKNQKIVKDDYQKKVIELANTELQEKIRSLENTIDNMIQKEKDRKSSRGGFGDDDNDEYQRLTQQVTSLTSKVEALSLENENHGKENQRLKTAMKVSEQRVKSALQDQMTLHHQLQTMEEELVSSKATITKLNRELEEQRSLRSFKEDAERKLFELQKEVSKREVELVEQRESSLLANKYHNELINAERTIEGLEQRLAEYSVELEKGAVAVGQLESYREQIKLKMKENRDLSLQIHSLESQLKDVPFLSNRFQEISEELQDCKIKVEKIPGLLAEIARLRGSSRASIKALAEQDKLMNHLKTRVKTLEKENALLKNDNRAMQDVETKLKESNTEIKRLMNMVTEVNALKAGAKNAEEEKKVLEGQYKKMRKFMRQSAVTPNAAAAGMASSSNGDGNQ